MKGNSVSTNILRDSNKELNYIVTPNTKELFERIFLNENPSSRSFNLIGNYGTGKSTFLWAVERNLLGEKIYFSDDYLIGSNKGFEIIKVIGDNSSLLDSLAETLNLKEPLTAKYVIDHLQRLRANLAKRSLGMVLMVDEFGKFLEHASKSNSLEDLYIVQLIAEWVNDADYNSYLVVTLHQNFSNYGQTLSSQDRLEWEKVKGRFTDMVFNEPVEQLIYFASNSLSHFELPTKEQTAFNKLVSIVEKSNLISLNKTVTRDVAEALFPLDWLSANILVNSLQRYGQNERSLFSFLNDNSKYSVKNLETTFYTVSRVFDYLVNTMPSEVMGPLNPHKPQWYSTFRALERAELIFKEDYHLASQVIKTIGLTNIFSKAGGVFDKKFVKEYFKYTCGEDVSSILDKLEKSGIVRFYLFSNKLNFLEGTDIDLEQELLTVSKEINPNFEITEELPELIEFSLMMAKRHSFNTGIPRFFEFKILQSSKEVELPKGSLDGYINLLFRDFKVNDIINTSKESGANIFVVYKDSSEIRTEIFSLKKFDLLLIKHREDVAAVKLLKDERSFHLTKLNELVVDNLFNADTNRWFFEGKEFVVTSKLDLNLLLSTVCDVIYHKSPKLLNELINKEHISIPINTARRNLIRQILSSETEKDLSYSEDKFPPDKAIYLSFLAKSGIHKKNNELGYYELSKPPQKSELYELWTASEDFLLGASGAKRNLSELYEKLSEAPFKLKKGFLEFWIPIFLLAKKEDFALFHTASGFIPFLDEDNLALIHKKPDSFLIKSYNVEGVKVNLLEVYKELVQVNGTKEEGNKSTFLTIFGNFLRFQRGLKPYSVNTQNLSEASIRLREAILRAKDPEEALFISFPAALGFHSISHTSDSKLLESYIYQLQGAIREIRTSYDGLLERIEKVLKEAFFCNEEAVFEDYKEEINLKLASVDVKLLSTIHTVFYKRLVSPLDDKESWVKSVADSAINKGVDNLSDEEEAVLYKAIEDLAIGLLKAGEIHEFNKVSNNERMISYQLFNPNGEVFTDKVILNNRSIKKQKSTKDVLIRELSKYESEERRGILLELLEKEFIES